MDERRAAERVALPERLAGTLGVVPVELVELSSVGARVEHEERAIVGSSPRLKIQWRGRLLTISTRVIRSEIAGRRGETLRYQSGIHFVDVDDEHGQLIREIIDGVTPSAAPPPPTIDFDDTLRRMPSFLRVDDDEEEKPYAQYRLTNAGWTKAYVDTPDQPEDGFTIAREDHDDLPAMQRTYESADDDTRRMMRIALVSQLQAKQSSAS